jgi:flagellar biosynthetic protein FliR
MYGSRLIPLRVKTMLAFLLSLCVYPTLLRVDAPSAGSIEQIIDGGIGLWGMAGAVGAELMIGLIIGFGANLPLIGMQVSGRIVDQQIGLGIGGVFNPDLDDESGVVGEFYFVSALAVFLLLGGHRVLLSTLVDSFGRVPLTGFTADGHMLDLLVGLLASMFDLALRVAGPLLCLVFLGTVAMGFIARTVPQMNILSVGFPVRILIGMIVIVGAIDTGMDVFHQTLRKSLSDLSVFFGF